ncbi:MAG: DUF4294 domain-containing protein [Paludibacteraceae bacterium]|nr:DUF4294 domain-containing protein [Paludibacteraceae bacterium]
MKEFFCNKIIIGIIIATAFAIEAKAQAGLFVSYQLQVERNGDTLYIAPMLPPAYCYPPMRFKNKKAEKFYWKTVRNVKKCLPYARIVSKVLNKANEDMADMDEKQKEIYLKSLEKEVKRKYEPIVRHMTYSQGKILIKLIDRETNLTSYELIKLYRGDLAAFFWQGVAKLFNADLKEEYDGKDKDKIIERIITLVEAGQL